MMLAMAHEITCASRSRPSADGHQHVLSVGLSDGRVQTVETVRFRISQGDSYFTSGAGRVASVRSYDCYCGVRTIRSGPESVLANSLDHLPDC